MNLWKKLKVKWKEWKIQREWRKVPVSEFPLRYKGSDLPSFRGLPGLTYGTPVAPIGGPKGATGAIRVVDPANVERVIHRKAIEYR